MPEETGDHMEWQTISAISKQYHMSRTTVLSRIKYMDSEAQGRYKGVWIRFDDRRPALINVSAFEDVCHYWTWLNDRNLKKHVPPYEPKKIVVEKEAKINKDEIRGLIREVLHEALG